jgi:hypothetical protein
MNPPVITTFMESIARITSSPWPLGLTAEQEPGLLGLVSQVIPRRNPTPATAAAFLGRKAAHQASGVRSTFNCPPAGVGDPHVRDFNHFATDS